MKNSKSFSARLSLDILLITSILFVLAIGVASVSSYIIIADEATKSAEHLLDAAIEKIESTLQKVEKAVDDAAWLVSENKYDEDYLYHVTDMIVRNNEDIIGSAIAFKPYYFEGTYYFSPYSFIGDSGEVESKQLGSPQYDYFNMDWYMIPYLLTEPCWSEPYFDSGGAEENMSTYSYPVKDEQGNVYAIITADISLNWVAEMLHDIKPYPSSEVSMISRTASFVNYDESLHNQGETIFSIIDRRDDRDGELKNIAQAIVRGEKTMMKYSESGHSYFMVFGPLSNGWKLSVSCDYRDVLARTATMQIILFIIGIFGLVILFLLCYTTIRKLTRPLSDFTRSAISIAKGDFNTELPEIKSEDEIHQLRDSFEFMQKSLTAYIEDLKSTTAANERFESELNIASNIQMSMLPKNFPNMDTCDLYAILKPAKEVGGDLYDFFVKGNYLNFAIGDVSGKGVPASLYMAITRAVYHFIAGWGLELDDVMENINNAISDGNDTGMFVTMFIGRLNLETGELEYCNAGHNPVVVNGEFLDVKPNIAVGLFPNFKYERQVVKLERGSRLILYTDGVSEAERASKELFGDDRLLQWCREPKKYHGARQACEGLLDTVHEFTQGNAQNDDITIVAIKLK